VYVRQWVNVWTIALLWVFIFGSLVFSVCIRLLGNASAGGSPSN